MKEEHKSIEAFMSLLKSGLWEQEAHLLLCGKVNYQEVMHLAEEHAVSGIIAAGLEHVVDVKVPKKDILQFVGQTLQLEQQNQAMNNFIGVLVDKMRKVGIYTLLVKGQGIAQCYEKPLWRASGDVDLYLSESNYIKAQLLLCSTASHVDTEDKKKMHLAMTIDSWAVELHGTLHTDLSTRINKGLDEIHHKIFYGGKVRSWNNAGTTIFLPAINEDVIIIFTHLLSHFFIEGVGFRQFCDWCRLLWKYKDQIDSNLLENRLNKMGLMRVWKVFATFAVSTLGMPEDAMPFYEKGKYSKRSKRVLNRVLKCGNFGHNNDLSYRTKYKGVTYKIVALYRRLLDFIRLSFIFPIDAPKFFVYYLFSKVF